MGTALSHYLDIIRAGLKLDFSSEKEVITELETHIEDSLQELREAGLSEEEATASCLGLMGSARRVARQLYEAHSQGTWWQTLLASTPHILFALLFALNWWRGVGWLLIMLILLLCTVVYGWFHGKPTWLFPWLGFSLLPVVVAGLLLLCLPEGWAWLSVFFYVPLAIWLVLSITVQAIKRDWLCTSLMWLPVPVIIGWLLAVRPTGRFPTYEIDRLRDFAPWIALSFLVLALAVAMFVRLRNRRLKVAVLMVSGLLALVMVAGFAEGRVTLVAFLALILMMMGLFLAPALLQRKIKYLRQQPRT